MMENREEFKVVEVMPMLSNCETLEEESLRKACTEKTVLRFIHEHLEYPEKALHQQIEGLVVVSFVINKEGEVVDVECMKDIGGGCGDEAIRVVELMNEKLIWKVGTQRGRPAKVKYNLPIRFKLPPKFAQLVSWIEKIKVRWRKLWGN